MEVLFWLLLIGGLIAIGVVIFDHTRKQNYIKSLEQLGWRWFESPDLAITVGLNLPPFGVGFNRRVDDRVLGKSRSGVPFQAFRYWSDSFKSDDYLLTMPLPKSLPTWYAFSASQPRYGVSGRVVASSPLQVVAPDLEYGSAVWAVLQGTLANPPRDSTGNPLLADISIDHNNLVMLHAPKAIPDLALAVEWLAGVQASLAASPAMQWDGPPPPTYLSLTELPHWEYIPRDDSMLAWLEHNTGGSKHEAVDIIKSDNFGLPFIRLTHNWQTTHTTTDAEGVVTTHTEKHSEELCQFQAPFPFRPISVNWGRWGQDRVQFESIAFNEAFKVNCPVPRFASDVFHPRQLEYLLRTRPIPFAISANGQIWFKADDWPISRLIWASNFLHGFFGRVQDFTWKELGAWPRPIPEVENYAN